MSEDSPNTVAEENEDTRTLLHRLKYCWSLQLHKLHLTSSLLTSHLSSPYLNSSPHHISSYPTASLPTNVLKIKIARCYPLTYGLSRPLQKSPSITYTALPSFPHNPLPFTAPLTLLFLTSITLLLHPLLSSFSPLPLLHVPNPPTTPTYATSRRKRKRKVSGP